MVDNTTNLPRSNTARRNRSYGYSCEAELLQFLRDNDIEAERLYLTGKEDEGDLFVSRSEIDSFGVEHVVDTIIQLKTWAPKNAKGEDRSIGPSVIANWLRDLKEQRGHYAAHRGLSELPGGMLIVRFKGRSWNDALVISQLKDWI